MNNATHTAPAASNFLNAQELNQAISRISAFEDSADLKASMDRGYIPTLRIVEGHDAQDRADILAVRAELKAHGLPVFPQELPEEAEAARDGEIVRVRKLTPTAVFIVTQGHLMNEGITAHGVTWIEATRRDLRELCAILADYDNAAQEGTRNYTDEGRPMTEAQVDFANRMADRCAEVAAGRIADALAK
jgi:hypothetical protein